MSQGSTGKHNEFEGDGSSADDNKRKRDRNSTTPENIYRKSKKSTRTSIGDLDTGNMADNGEIKEMLQILMQEVQEIRKENKEYREDLLELKEQNEKMRGEIKQLRERVEELEIIEKQVDRMDKAGRRDNIVLSGIEIKGNSSEEMANNLEEFIQQNMQVETKIKEVHKINERMWMAKVESFEKKVVILKNKHKLRNGTQKNVYITSDLTEQERRIQKKIRERAEKERNGGKRVRIGYQKLIIENKKWVWNHQSQEIEQEKEIHVTKN